MTCVKIVKGAEVGFGILMSETKAQNVIDHIHVKSKCIQIL